MSLFKRLSDAFSAFNNGNEVKVNNEVKNDYATLEFNLSNPIKIDSDKLPMTVKGALYSYSEELGLDESRVTTYMVNNVKVSLDYNIQVGDIVRFLVTSEGKGLI